MNDSDLMPFGKYKGEAMANVPASYLVWFWDTNSKNSSEKVGENGKKVLEYIRDYGIEHLRKEAKNG